MQSFSSVPLGSLVDDRVKAKVWANQFVELELLVGESAPQTMYLLDSATDRPVVQIRDQPNKKIINIEQWTDAFLIYIAIYTERHPTDTPDILKYLQLIRTMSHDSRPSLFLTYDRNFRKLRAHNGMPWYKLHQELFSLATPGYCRPNSSIPSEEAALSQEAALSCWLSPRLLLLLCLPGTMQKS